MRCMVVRERDVRAFFEFFFSFSSFKCKCRMQMPRLVLPMRYVTIVPKNAVDRLLTTDLNVNFLMNANEMWCKSRFFFPILMLLDKNANAKFFLFKMQMSYAGMKMQSLFLMMPAHIFNRDVRVSLQGWRCKFLVVQMPSNGHVMMQMFM